MKARRHAGQFSGAKTVAGFTVLEVIVAFALMALAFTVLLASLSGAARQVRRSEDLSRASLHGQSLLSQVGIEIELEPGRTEGKLEDGRYQWSLDVQPYSDPTVSRPPRGTAYPGQLYQLTLDMRWGSELGQQIRWKTLRLASQSRALP